jgi:Transglutaminase-like enzymes, putative cysteine proteases
MEANGQTIHQDLPVIKAKSVQADYKIGKELIKGSWIISPQIEADTLLVTCHSPVVPFVFYTDTDSIAFKLTPGQVCKFYVAIPKRAYALTVVRALDTRFDALAFDTQTKDKKIKCWYEQNNRNEYMDLLRSKYPVDSLVKDAKTDMEKALGILHWVHRQWKHNGSNEPKKRDAISILDEAKMGNNFRCVEYGIVTAACLNAIGLKARVLGLKTKDVETTEFGAGHVLTEVYLNDLKKWAFLDGQWDAMPVLNNIPLNAVEFQHAIATGYDNLNIVTASGTNKKNYVEWIFPYLYYFNFPFDNRVGTAIKKNKIKGKMDLMLVPTGAKNPTVFQIKVKLNYCLYTHSINDFYAAPDNPER